MCAPYAHVTDQRSSVILSGMVGLRTGLTTRLAAGKARGLRHNPSTRPARPGKFRCPTGMVVWQLVGGYPIMILSRREGRKNCRLELLI